MLIMPMHLRKAVRTLIAAGGHIARDGGHVLIDGPPALADAVRVHIEELARYVVPSVTTEEAALVREILADAGISVAYITEPDVARQAVAGIVAGVPAVVGLDFETEVLPGFRQPISLKFNKDGKLAVQQPKDGAAGAALDPYRSKVRLVQARADGEHVYVFDKRSVAWTDIAPLFELPLAIFNAVFEVKRLIHEAKIEPTGRIYDVMTAIWLTHGCRPSLGEAVPIFSENEIKLPKVLGASDWSADTLTIEQLEYAALDAVLCRMLWNAQQEMLDDDAKQCQEITDAVIPAIAHAELNGMPINVTAHRAQNMHWQTDLAAAEKALYEASPLRDLRKPAELQAYLKEVLDADALAEWPRTKKTGKLKTTGKQLQLNDQIPALTELLRVRALRKLLDAFGESLIEDVSPVTGRLHTNFLIAGARTGRFSSKTPNMQQMPKQREAGFRKIFAAPPGQLVMALDYSQIELRAVGELISDWQGYDSILRSEFALGMDAHTATAMAMTGKNRIEDVTKEERQQAKPCNFGLLYLMGDNGFYNYVRVNFNPNIIFEEACDLKTRFFDARPDLKQWQEEYKEHAREQGYTQTKAGRRWYSKWKARNPDEVDEDTPFYEDVINGFSGSYAVNHPVQGSAAEVMQIALTRLHQTLRNEPAQIIATVHDEAVLLVPDDPESVARIGAIAQQEMIAAFLEVFPDAPTLNLVDPKVGPTWGDLQDLPTWLAAHV